jgi:hypothetical protein
MMFKDVISMKNNKNGRAAAPEPAKGGRPKKTANIRSYKRNYYETTTQVITLTVNGVLIKIYPRGRTGEEVSE